MDEKIKEKLKEYSLSIEDLTLEELEELKEEIKEEERGMTILDSVLSRVPIYRSIIKR